VALARDEGVRAPGPRGGPESASPTGGADVHGTRREAGVTLIEIMTVVAIVGILAAAGSVALEQWAENQRARNAAQDVAGAFHVARTEAIRTGHNHVVFLNTGAGTDACGNALLTDDGQVAPVLVLDDGEPGGPDQDCCLDAGENRISWRARADVAWGAALAGAPAPGDSGGGSLATGSTFTAPNGTQTSWVLFRPDGVPVAFSSACNPGTTGSGGGGVYVTNGQRDYAVVLSPLGGAKVHAFDANADGWAP